MFYSKLAWVAAALTLSGCGNGDVDDAEANSATKVLEAGLNADFEMIGRLR